MLGTLRYFDAFGLSSYKIKKCWRNQAKYRFETIEQVMEKQSRLERHRPWLHLGTVSGYLKNPCERYILVSCLVLFCSFALPYCKL